MYENRYEFRVARMACVLEVSESGYYKWLNRHKNGKVISKEEILLRAKIKEIYIKSRCSFGARKVTKAINKHRDFPVNHKRIERIMREYCFYSTVSKKYICTTDSKHNEAIADNLLERDFTASGPNEKMLSDTTVIKTKQGKLYVAGILDLYGRMPVGLAMSNNNDTELVKDALKDMILRGGGREGCILHSDRGSTYASGDYRNLLAEHGFLCSMSRKGDCWDNAPMESFWGKMKQEWLKPKYATRLEAARDVYEYVWYFYPHKRPHQSNEYLTPAEIYQQG